MSPEAIYQMFCKEFPNAASQVTRWFGRKKRPGDTYEKGSIRLVMKTGKTLIFGVHGDGSWSLSQ